MSQTSYPGQPVRNDIDFGAFGRAWEIAQKNIGIFMVASLVCMLPTFVVSGVFQILMPRPSPDADPSVMMAMLGPMYAMIGLSTVVNSLVQGISTVAMAHFCLAAVRNGQADINDAVAGFKRFGPAMLAGLVYTLATYIGLLGCCIGAFVVAALLIFMYCDVADGTNNVIEAAMASFERTKDKILPAIAFMFLYGIVTALGVLACGIGILFTMPLAMTALCLVYCDLTGTGPNSGQTWAGAPGSPYPRGQQAPYDPSDPPQPPEPPRP